MKKISVHSDWNWKLQRTNTPHINYTLNFMILHEFYYMANSYYLWTHDFKLVLKFVNTVTVKQYDHDDNDNNNSW